jgi:hypothetical protein
VDLPLGAVPGTLLVQFLVDSPRGPRGLLGGRRGCSALGYTLTALAGFAMAFRTQIGDTGVLVSASIARAALAASNAAMWIAAPEMYVGAHVYLAEVY